MLRLSKIPALLCLLVLSIGLAACASDRSLTTGSTSSPYLLGPGDKIRVLVFGQPDLSNSYHVNQSGQISMPLIGTLQADGLTSFELEAEIRRELMQGYLRDPRVAVEIEEYRPFYVLGEVGQSGSYSWREGLTVQRAVALAGGFSPRASSSRVSVSRNINGVNQSARVPLDFPVMPGDTIEVHQRLF